MNLQVVFFCDVPLAIFAHEIGHATVAWLAGLSPRVINIGAGRVLIRLRIINASLVVRAVPLHGYVVTLPDPPGRRAAIACLMLGGVLGNLSAITILAMGSALFPPTSAIFGALAATNGWVIISTLFPIPTKLNGVWHYSDGLQLLRLAFRRRKDNFNYVYDHVMSAYGPPESGPRTPSVDAREIIFQIFRTDTECEAWARADMNRMLRIVLDRGRLTAPERLLVLENLIGMELTFSDRLASDGELEEWSTQAVELFDFPPARVTRGAVLVRIGRPLEARSILTAALGRNLTPTNLVACHAFLAQAEAAIGNISAARQWIVEAHTSIGESERLDLLPLLDRLAPDGI